MNVERVVIGAQVLLLLSSAACFSQDSATRAQQIAEHQRKAQLYLRDKKASAAIPELQAILTLDPGSMETRANLGVLLFFQGRLAEATPQLKAAIDAKPDLWKIRSLLGMAERRTGHDPEGRSDLEAAFPNVEDQKLKIDVGRELIESYAASSDLDKASDTIGALLKLEPTDPSLLYTSYRIHTQMAVAAMLELGLAAPDSAQIHQAMAHELQRDHDLAGTIANLRKALALDPSLPGIHFELAEALHASDDQRLRAESAEQYKLAVETSPTDPKAATRMGDIQADKGDLDAAATFYHKALKLQPSSAEATIGLANVLAQRGKPEEAATMLEQVEAADPTNVLVHFRLSAIYRKLNRPDDVKRELDLYKTYKDERDKLRAVYQQLRLTTSQNETEK